MIDATVISGHFAMQLACPLYPAWERSVALSHWTNVYAAATNVSWCDSPNASKIKKFRTWKEENKTT